MENKIVAKLVEKHGKIMKFKNLPIDAKLAMIWYMGLDGEAFIIPKNLIETDKEKQKQVFRKNISYFDKKYGNRNFGLAYVPRLEFEKSLLDNMGKDSADFDLNNFISDTTKHKKNTWPVILSCFEELELISVNRYELVK